MWNQVKVSKNSQRRFSWGLGITFLYSGFVVLIIGMVVMAMRQKVDLVSRDYYEQELKFQDKIDQVGRTALLQSPLTWEVKPDVFSMRFPAEFQGQKISGNIYFFNPSDDKKDKKIALSPDASGLFEIPTAGLKKGVFKIQVSWQVKDVTYYNEGFVQIH
jgi:nitrogen fixation protein FixH